MVSKDPTSPYTPIALSPFPCSSTSSPPTPKQHGSLSVEAGRVDVCWHLDDGELVLTWTESGGPPARSPLSPGFGNLLVAYAAVKLKGTADHLYKQSGLICNLRISLRARWPRRRGAMLLGAATRMPAQCAQLW